MTLRAAGTCAECKRRLGSRAAKLYDTPRGPVFLCGRIECERRFNGTDTPPEPCACGLHPPHVHIEVSLVSELDLSRLAKGIRAAIETVPLEEHRAAAEATKAIANVGPATDAARVLATYLAARYKVRKAGWGK